MRAGRILPIEKGFETPASLGSSKISAVLWESFWKALIRTFLIQILGSLAVGFLGDIFSEMAPTLPPVFGHKQTAEAAPHPGSHPLGKLIAENWFWITFAVLFVAGVATRFSGYLRDAQHRKLAALFLRSSRRITQHWFRIFVLNAFSAWITATILLMFQGFSKIQIFWDFVGALLQPVFHALTGWIPGGGVFGTWFSWYSQNQGKFLFWLLYSAAICDDLGLPNYKALIRWAGRRLISYFRESPMEGASRPSPAMLDRKP